MTCTSHADYPLPDCCSCCIELLEKRVAELESNAPQHCVRCAGTGCVLSEDKAVVTCFKCHGSGIVLPMRKV